jgi:hypothetical protein
LLRRIRTGPVIAVGTINRVEIPGGHPIRPRNEARGSIPASALRLPPAAL